MPSLTDSSVDAVIKSNADHDIDFFPTEPTGFKAIKGLHFGVYFRDCTIGGLKLENCILVNAVFKDCHFLDTMLSNVVMVNVELTGCIFNQYTWQNGKWEGETFHGRDFELPDLGLEIPEEVKNPEMVKKNLGLPDHAVSEYDQMVAAQYELADEQQAVLRGERDAVSETPSGKNLRRTGNPTKLNPTKSVTVKPERAFPSSAAGIVVGKEQYGFPIVDHPMFPRSELKESTSSESSAGATDYDEPDSLPHFELNMEKRREGEAAEAAGAAAINASVPRIFKEGQTSGSTPTNDAKYKEPSVAELSERLLQRGANLPGGGRRVVPGPAGSATVPGGVGGSSSTAAGDDEIDGDWTFINEEDVFDDDT